MTEQEKLDAARRGQLQTAQAFSTPTATPKRDIGLIERFTMNAEDAWKTGTLAGQGYLQTKAAFLGKERVQADEKLRKEQYDAATSWNGGPREKKTVKYTNEFGIEQEDVVDSDPNALRTLAHGGAALAGQVVGNAATPETFVVPAPARLATAAVQASTATGRALGKAAVGGATQAVVNAATDPLIQGSEIMLGTRDSYDPTRTLVAGGLGAVTGGVFPQLPAAVVALDRRNQALRAALGDQYNTITDFHKTFKVPDDLKREKYIGSFNTEKTKLSESAYDEVNRVVKDNDQYMEARRGHLSGDIDQVKQLALDLNRPEDYYLRRWEPGVTFAPEDIWQIRKLHANAAENVVHSARLAADGDELAMQHAAIAYQRFQQFEAILQGSATEWGRTGAIFNEVISSEERNAAVKHIEKKFGGKIGAKEFFTLMASLDDPRMVRKFAQEAEKASTGKMLIEAWQSALLSSPDTHVANMIGSLTTTLMSTPETIGASLVGKVRNAAFGGENAVSTQAAVARVAGMLHGARDGLRLAAEAFRTERAPGIQTRDVHQHIPDRLGGGIIRTPLRALLAEDTFFKTINKHMALREMAWDEVIRRAIPPSDRADFIRNFINNPPAHVASKADAIGRYYTFNSDLGKMGNAILQFKEAHPLAALVMPFVRTPINIIKQGFERSPFAVAYIANGMRTGKLKGKELDMAISRATIGSGIMAFAAYQAYLGNIVGSGPMDPGQRAAIADTGAQTVSIRVGDEFHSFSRLQPIGMTLGLAADYVQAQREYMDSVRSGKRDETGNPAPEALWRAAEYAVWATTKNMLQGSFVTQLNNLFDAMTAPDRNLQRFVNTTAGSVVPTVVARVAQGTDPLVREPQSVGEMLASRIPGQTDKAQPMLNRFGDPRKREAGLLEQMLWPFRRTKLNNDPVYKEIARLGVHFDDLPKYWEGRKLTPDQYTDLVQFTGRLAKKQLDALITSPNWNKIPDNIQIEEIRKILTDATKDGKDLFIAKYPKMATEQPNEQIRKLQESPRPQYPFLK
jgi:hypothetical protein